MSPYVILNAGMTLDGKISTRGEDSLISCERDLDRAHSLRSNSDAVMVGVGTILADDPCLTVRRVEGENPVRIVLDSEARTPSDSSVLDDSASTIIAVSDRAEKSEVDRLESQGAEVIVRGSDRVDLKSLMEELADKGIERLLLEGGSTLNWGMLSEGLVDEIRVAISPRIVGGEDAKTLVGGRGFERVSDGVELNMERVDRVGENLLLVYKVVKGSDQTDR